jgi:hypothetical protein
MNRGQSSGVARLVSVLCVCAAPAVLHAQPAIDDASASSWLWRWSPVRAIGDLALPGARGVEAPRLLDLPAPRVGLAWTTGNPAGLQDDLIDAWTQLLIGTGGVSGSYRRPLDPGSARTVATGIGAWRRVSSRLAAIGRVAVEVPQVAAGSPSAFVSPYGSSPFVPTDTNRPALHRPTVTIEGAEAIALGAWRLGASAGFHLLENTSSRSAAAVIGRASLAGVTLGASRRVGKDAQIGIQLRMQDGSESVTLFPNPQTIRVYALDGLVGVEPRDFSPGVPPFFRRADRSARALGLDAGGRLRGTSWGAYAHAEHGEEVQVFGIVTGAPVDRWITDGLSTGVAIQRRLWKTTVTIRSDVRVQRGDANRTTTTGGAYSADASSFSLVADLRSSEPDDRWPWAVVAGAWRDAQATTDRAARMSTDIVAWSPGLSADVGKVLSSRVTVLIGYGVTGFTPNAGIPSPEGRTRAYRTLIAPAMEMAAAATQSDRLTLSARWWRSSARRRSLTASAWRARTSVRARPTDPDILLPFGSRTSWGVGVRVGAGQ